MNNDELRKKLCKNNKGREIYNENYGKLMKIWDKESKNEII